MRPNENIETTGTIAKMATLARPIGLEMLRERTEVHRNVAARADKVALINKIGAENDLSLSLIRA